MRSRPDAASTVPTTDGPHLPPLADRRAPRRDRSGATMASIRSCDSLVMTSNGSMPGSRRGHLGDVRRPCPTPPLAAVSLVAHVSPAPPRSWTPTTRPASSSARQASISRFSSNGSPTCTLGRLRGVGLVVAEAGRRQHAHAADAVAPGRRTEQHGEVADAGGPPEHQPVGRQHAEAQHVDERILRVASRRRPSRRRPSARRPSCRSPRCPTRRPRRSSGCEHRRADRSAAGPSPRSDERPS